MQLVSISFADDLPMPAEFAFCDIDAKTHPARKIQSIEPQRHSKHIGKTRGLVSPWPLRSPRFKNLPWTKNGKPASSVPLSGG